MDDRMENLESQSAHQEQAIHDLSEALISQQQRIDQLEQRLERLSQQFTALAEQAGGPGQDEVPPHY